MKKYTKPISQICEFSAADIITASQFVLVDGYLDPQNDDLIEFVIPSSPSM